MTDSMRRTQEAFNMLNLLNRQTSEFVTLFKTDWIALFNAAQVPPVQQFEKQDSSLVRINRNAAVEYLKQTYNFYTKKELTEVLEEIAQDYER